MYELCILRYSKIILMFCVLFSNLQYIRVETLIFVFNHCLNFMYGLFLCLFIIYVIVMIY